MIAVNYIGWCLPLLLLPLSYFTFKIKGIKKYRYLAYFSLLLVAFIFNLTGLSFRADSLDTILYLAASFILSEFFWNVTRLKNRVVVGILVGCGFIMFGVAFKDWFSCGPQKNARYWVSQSKEQFLLKNSVYRVKESYAFDLKKMNRAFTLYRDVSIVPLESQIGTYVLPDGYFKSEIRFHWSKTQAGVKMDLIGDADTLWSLGEGL